MLCNIKEILSSFIQAPKKQSLSSIDLNNIINYIFPNQNIKYDNIKEEKKNIYHPIIGSSKRGLIDEINNIVLEVPNEAIEPIILALNYFVDLYAIKPFNINNDALNYVVLYLLLLKCDIKAVCQSCS